MSDVRSLIADVRAARRRFLSAVARLSPDQAHFKPDPGTWSAVENTEHITLAEQGGICWIWKALEAHRRGEPLWTGDPVHRGRSIEEVVERTWKPKEEVPPVAAPRWGGPLAYWTASLEACQGVLESLGTELQGARLEDIIYPHPISGPLDARQRIEFLRFHLDRHRDQVERLRRHRRFPDR